MSPLVHISVTDGHHLSYQSVFLRMLGGKPSTGPIRGRRLSCLMRAPDVLFCTIDTDYPGFVAVALVRALQRKPTTGLFLRPLQCFRAERPIVYRLKRRLFRWLCRLPQLRILTIIPHDMHPELREVSHDWIHDPQMWDLWVEGRPVLPDTDLSDRVVSANLGRKVIIYVGAGNGIKGFPDFVEHVEKAQQSVLAVVAGRVNNKYRQHADSLRELGMIVEDRYVTDEEILSLYKIADCAWCRYSPEYDQASGVFGRALQTGVTPLVREGSLLDRILELHSYSPEASRSRAIKLLSRML